MLAGDGAGIGVDTARLHSVAQALQGLSRQVAGSSADLVGGLAEAENAVGDPAAASALSDLVGAWIGPLGLLGPLLDRVSSSVAASASVYSETDSGIARHVR